jgi:hypothetical protein
MIATTIISSMRVKPFWIDFIAAPSMLVGRRREDSQQFSARAPSDQDAAESGQESWR